MLEELNVRNYALIENLSLSFEKGLSILTGETGAGKSIIVGALGFLLGAKADTEVIRTGSEEASVSAVVSLGAHNREALDWLKSRDIESEDGKVIIRRNIKSSGRGAVYIQNAPVTRNDLAEFMAFLFDLHGQHAHESLLHRETHRAYLDRFAGIEDETLAFNRVFLSLADRRKAFETSLGAERDRDTRLEMLNYAIGEISQAGIKSGESRDLESEAARLASFEKLTGQVNNAASILFDDEVSILSLTRRARSALESAAAIDGSLSAIQQRLTDLYYEAEDLTEEFRSYRDDLKYDPERQEAVEERLALLYRLKKKYGADEDAVLAYQASAAAEIEALTGAGENREKLRAEITALEKDVAGRAASLSAKRTAAALTLGTRITEIISNLGMPKARFSVAVSPKRSSTGQGSSNLLCGPWGADEVEFLISANAGEPLKELSRIASGGELSRVMLAIKTVLAGTDTAGNDASAETLIFDEIDTGIGGEVALSVGEYLTKIGRLKQIFCVTHLASIAVRADHHLRVEKQVFSGGKNGDTQRTVTTVSVLKSDERRQEIARMLAGDAGPVALAHADALLLKYGK
jgi:DNA repair protein RecN (Recombination protein N)